LLGPDPVKRSQANTQSSSLRYYEATLVKQFLWKRTSILSDYSPPEDQNRNEGPYRFGSLANSAKCNSSSKSREAWRPTVRIQPSTCVEPTRTELNGVEFFAAAANQAHGPVPQLVSTVEERKQIRAPNLQLPTRSSSSLLK